MMSITTESARALISKFQKLQHDTCSSAGFCTLIQLQREHDAHHHLKSRKQETISSLRKQNFVKITCVISTRGYF